MTVGSAVFLLLLRGGLPPDDAALGSLLCFQEGIHDVSGDC